LQADGTATCPVSFPQNGLVSLCLYYEAGQTGSPYQNSACLATTTVQVMTLQEYAFYAGRTGTNADVIDVLALGWGVNAIVDIHNSIMLHLAAEDCANPEQEAKIITLLTNGSSQPKNNFGDTPWRIASVRCGLFDPATSLLTPDT
jgi:hypothetical protein